MDQWHRIKYFKREENWGNPLKIEEELVLKLDNWREKIGSPVIVTSGTQGVHVENSYHYKGMAVDVVVRNSDKHPLDLIFLAVRCDFKGIGYYTHWRYKNIMVPGFHLDIRTSFGSWMGVFNPIKDKREYHALNHKNLKTYGII